MGAVWPTPDANTRYESKGGHGGPHDDRGRALGPLVPGTPDNSAPRRFPQFLAWCTRTKRNKRDECFYIYSLVCI
jgi:hypothetical protein